MCRTTDIAARRVQHPHRWRRPAGVAPGTWDYVHDRKIADRYDQFVAESPLCKTDLEVLDELFPHLGHGAGQLVVDLGAGTGRASLPLASRGYDVLAIDLSQSMLDRLLEKASRRTLQGRVFALRANLARLSCLQTASADHAVCLFSTLGMIRGRSHRLALLAELTRVVRGGGKIVIHVHNRWAWLVEPGGVRRMARSYWNSIRCGEDEFGDAVYPYRGLQQMFMHRFTRRELHRDLRACGILLQEIRPLSIDGSTLDVSTPIPGGYIALGRIRNRLRRHR